MKTKITLIVFLLFSLSFSHSQSPIEPNPNGGGEFAFNAEQSPCLSDNQRAAIKSDVTNSMNQLIRQNKLAYDQTSNRGGHPLFIWPVQKTDGLQYNDVWGISGYVDHNVNYPNQLTDYNCGTTTYDNSSGYNHQGVDIYTWPFGLKMMDFNEAEIIAAAPGQIIAKNDGEYDRSCDFNSNIWNAIYIQHSDGSIAWYGHMKNGSLSTKNVGDMVTVGEYLGVVGSSGNSTGPHLHFEVYTDATYTQLVDPYSGSCNNMNASSWWVDQKPYKNPNINAVITHSAPPEFPGCPTQEITNESNDFDTSATITFGLYMRDQANNTSINLKVIRPDNSVVYNWDFPFTADYSSSYWYWQFADIYDMNGEWKWEATYQGQTVTHTFNISGFLSVANEDFSETSIYPNPFNTIVNINSATKVTKVNVVDVLGKTVYRVDDMSEEGINKLNLTQLSKGLYFVTLQGEQDQKKTIKVIKK
ncbi:peptidoglycan DD-metalloendopeptidase family protein [Winogradskyella forsetii]|uniref:peptidoglycan DD-metalloendopeptidase family protein n=1 Tax=Winogradskyella forsetii TaxID=2686077 RepID=UPI0015BF2670|nr:peptidoglycan DD-metalloendopeptidase family protein [Winogradskyella forsetii]